MWIIFFDDFYLCREHIWIGLRDSVRWLQGWWEEWLPLLPLEPIQMLYFSLVQHKHLAPSFAGFFSRSFEVMCVCLHPKWPLHPLPHLMPQPRGDTCCTLSVHFHDIGAFVHVLLSPSNHHLYLVGSLLILQDLAPMLLPL